MEVTLHTPAAWVLWAVAMCLSVVELAIAIGLTAFHARRAVSRRKL